MSKLLVCFPVGPEDGELALSTLRTAQRFQPKVPFPFVIVSNLKQDVSAIRDAAAEIFSKVDVLQINPCPYGQSWPRPQNWTWQRAARRVDRANVCETWFWWEPDAIPMQKDFLTILWERHLQGGKPFSGPITTNTFNQRYMAGVGFYPYKIIDHCLSALTVVEKPFDIVASVIDKIVPAKVQDISDLICHVGTKANTEFFSKRDIKLLIPPTSVLFHKCKDGSLGEVLSGIKRSRPKIITHEKSVPSFTEQTKFPCGYFAFPVAPADVCYYNPSIVRHQGKLFLFTRRHSYGRDPQTGRVYEGYGSSLSIFKVRENMTLEWPSIDPKGPDRWSAEQWEDPKVYQHNGTLFVSMATWVHFKQWKIRQSFVHLLDNMRRFEVIMEPDFGGNSPVPDAAREHEKNWVWFMHDGAWHFQYMINPKTIVRVKDWKVDEVYSSSQRKIPWQFGILRGGTQLTQVGDELIGFFHSATMWQEPKRRYYMGAYALEARPPFNLKRISKTPILTGSEEDFRILGGPLVIFPNGAILEKDNWLVVFGVNDEHCGWIKIPHEHLDKSMVPV